MTTVDPAFEALLEHIREQRAFDFTGYKRASLARRVQRRMESVGIGGYDEYLDQLIVHPDEFTHLFNTVLINVTSFFRDADAWAYLQSEILPGILQRREEQPIRVWSAGCASGEEAYSLAIALAELLGIDDFRHRVKIYATDVDEEALAQARQATYSERELRSVDAGLRDKYFEPVNNRFVFRKELRRSVIFGRNDLVQDAPISHVDVLACRNTLMYFNAETQSQILNRMHFALHPDGILFLGKAEMLLTHSEHFRPVELKRRFFTKINTEKTVRRQIATPEDARAVVEDRPEMDRLRQAALMSSASAQIVLDPEGNLAVSNLRAMHLFGLGPRDVGRPIRDLEISYRPVELRAHIEEAQLNRRQVWIRDVEQVRTGGEALCLDVQIVPLVDETGSDLGLTIVFNDVTQARQLQKELTYANRQLEIAYEELQSTNEELETTNEELQSTVEELETTNEELQSTNEELETMNEELQSMNDELQLSNSSLRDQQNEVERLNRFMSAVLGSMNSGVVVVDADMQIRAWNSRAEDLWGVRTDEALGEHLLNLDIGLPMEQLRQSIRSHLGDAELAPTAVLLDAVNRRGKPLVVRVTLTHIHDNGEARPAAMIVMDVIEDLDT
jgi:two-component system CheB/CheR fusion protein